MLFVKVEKIRNDKVRWSDKVRFLMFSRFLIQLDIISMGAIIF